MLMGENKDLQIVFQEIANQNMQAKDIVGKCVEFSDEDAKEFLALYIKNMEKHVKLIPYDKLKKLTSVVHRGLKFESEQAEALKYFYFGYYAKCQENILNQAEEYYQRIKIDEIASKKHFKSIMRYLASNGISRQKDISVGLNINKSNLSRLLDEVVEHKLVNKMIGPRVVFYELTAAGYKYCKTHNLNISSTINKNIWLDNNRVLAYRKAQFNYHEIKEVDYNEVDAILMLNDNNSTNKANFESKFPFTESIEPIEPNRYSSFSKNIFDFEIVLENNN